MEYPGRDRIADLNVLADHILRGLYTWTMPADYGFRTYNGKPERSRCYFSSSEIIGNVLEIPWPGDEVGDYPEDLHAYARKLFQDVGTVLRARGGPKPQPEPPPRPPWADMVSKDGLVEWHVPQELIPFVRVEIAGLSGMMGNYDTRRGYSTSFLENQWNQNLEIWRLRKKVHDLTGGQGT